MSLDKSRDRLDQIVARAQRDRDARLQAYREKALKMYPWICGRCCREFNRENLRELTVHHRDHDHDNNPSDGSNWELLCMYCHDNEHSRLVDAHSAAGGAAEKQSSVSTYQPFANLAAILKNKK
jgi:5-methylcytosine-specific restriction endonuclease McrA